MVILRFFHLFTHFSKMILIYYNYRWKEVKLLLNTNLYSLEMVESVRLLSSRDI